MAKQKAPSFPFYVRDWLTDERLRMASPDVRGVWIDVLCYMWLKSPRGIITGTIKQISRLLREDQDLILKFVFEAAELEFADIELDGVTPCNENVTALKRDCNAVVTVINRRMYRKEKNKENTKIRVKRYRERAKCNENVTDDVTTRTTVPASSFASSLTPYSPPFEKGDRAADDIRTILDLLRTTEPINTYAWNEAKDGKWIGQIIATYGGKLDLASEVNKAALWCQANGAKKNYKKFLTNWFSKAAEIAGQRDKGNGPKPQADDGLRMIIANMQTLLGYASSGGIRANIDEVEKLIGERNAAIALRLARAQVFETIGNMTEEQTGFYYRNELPALYQKAAGEVGRE